MSACEGGIGGEGVADELPASKSAGVCLLEMCEALLWVLLTNAKCLMRLFYLIMPRCEV